LRYELHPPEKNGIDGEISGPPQSVSCNDYNDLARRGVLKDIVVKLESIFAKSTAIHKKNDIKTENSEDSFYKALGRVSSYFVTISFIIESFYAPQSIYSIVSFVNFIVDRWS